MKIDKEFISYHKEDVFKAGAAVLLLALAFLIFAVKNGGGDYYALELRDEPAAAQSAEGLDSKIADTVKQTEVEPSLQETQEIQKQEGNQNTSKSDTSPADIALQDNAGRINLNTASSAELQRLKGIGEVTAGKIIDYRERNGPFKRIEDLKKVNGIGEKKFEAVKGDICV